MLIRANTQGGLTPLMVAARVGQFAAMKQLIEESSPTPIMTITDAVSALDSQCRLSN